MKILSSGAIAIIIFLMSNSIIIGQQNGKAFFSIKGHDLYDSDGNKFLLKGINLGNWLNPEGYMFLFENTSSARLIDQAFREMIGPDFTDEFWKLFKDNYITEEDIRYISETGINSIRIPFHYKLFTDEDYMGLKSSQNGFELIDRLLIWCRKYNVYIILDMHDAPGGQTGDNIDDSYGYPWLMVSEKSQNVFVEIWTKIAERYSNEKMIIGYDLLNEPIATYYEKEYQDLNPLLEPLYKRAVKSIRNVDKNHIVLLGGAQWNSNFSVFTDAKFDDKIMYTCHRYWCDTLQQNIQDFVDFRDSVDLPMYMGETGENTDQWISAWTRLMVKNNIGYHYWPYKKMKNPSCMVSIKVPENWDKIVEYAEGPRKTFSEIRSRRPDPKIVKKAMYDLIENIRFKNCQVNKSYVKAIGF
jgi:endoglucanase